MVRNPTRKGPFSNDRAPWADHRCDLTHRWIHFDLTVVCFPFKFGEFGSTCEEFPQIVDRWKSVSIGHNCIVDGARIEGEANVPIWHRNDYPVGHRRRGLDFLQCSAAFHNIELPEGPVVVGNWHTTQGLETGLTWRSMGILSFKRGSHIAVSE